jgi:lipoprotein-anchoring transpeptidase ErfK/SrfK
VTKKKKQFSISLFIVLLVLAIIAAVLVFTASINNSLQTNLIPKAACGSKNPQANSSNFDSNESVASWLGEAVLPPAQDFYQSPQSQALAQTQVLGETSQLDQKWLDVDLTNQTVSARDGDKVIYQFPISSGKFAPTPTGEYNVWYKVKYTKMEGGVKGTGTYYYLPNVPYVLFFYQGYGFHGTYWHTNFGTPMSHGCVNLSIGNAEKLFYWAGPTLPLGKNSIMASDENPGTKVVVHGIAPRI